LNGVRIGLHHGVGGPAYAESYKLQKYLEKIGGGQKPQIYILGQYHSALSMFCRNVFAFMPGCFQRPTDLSVRLGLPNTVGGWIVELEVENDKHHTIQTIKSEYVAYY
jgi:predicted phosphodiesterase